ncbi:hypothetical protein FQN50_001329 [Emmonsiellopsis sp. PD_5]|nr:hypothetical protein FQN50_001329 [Emmonsiellopsis sp. PD_5]
MSRSRGTRVVSLRGIFGRKTLRKPTTASGVANNPRTTKTWEPARSRVTKSQQRKQAYFGHRYQKPTSKASSGPVSSRERLLNDFAGSIDATRHEIAGDVSNSLVETQKALESRLADVIAKHDEKLELSQANRAAILTPLEETELPMGSSLKQHPAGIFKEQKTLADRLALVQNTLDREERDIRGLWKAWNKTQQRIICLGVEVLGSENVSLPMKAPTGSFKKRLSGATAVSEQRAGVEKEMVEDMKKRVGDIRELTRDARKQFAAQEKKSRDDKRKQREEICQLARKMIADI